MATASYAEHAATWRTLMTSRASCWTQPRYCIGNTFNHATLTIEPSAKGINALICDPHDAYEIQYRNPNRRTLGVGLGVLCRQLDIKPQRRGVLVHCKDGTWAKLVDAKGTPVLTAEVLADLLDWSIQGLMLSVQRIPEEMRDAPVRVKAEVQAWYAAGCPDPEPVWVRGHAYMDLAEKIMVRNKGAEPFPSVIQCAEDLRRLANAAGPERAKLCRHKGCTDIMKGLKEGLETTYMPRRHPLQRQRI